MFKIDTFHPELDGMTLKLSDRLFRDALKCKPVSMERFHVSNDRGEDFDIVYWDNNDDIEPVGAYPDYVKPPYMARYLKYYENNKNILYLGFFEGLKDMVFEELNEYTIVLTRVVLKFTNMEVWCSDERILWFVKEDPRIHIVKELPQDYDNETCLYIQEALKTGLEDNNFNRLSSTYAFHNVFFIQDILKGRPHSGFKYVTIEVNDIDGIGSILQSYVRFQNAFGYFGMKFIAPDEDHIGRFPRELMEHYFSLKLWENDANRHNTLVLPTYIVKTAFFQKQPNAIDTSIIASAFRKEMDEYYDAVFGTVKTLGVLIRGSDYIATGLTGSRKMATVDQMIPTIRKWMSDYGYEKIFLATEDKDILDQMRSEFGRSMAALSQERISTDDLKKGQVISDYEKEQGGEDYNDKLKDTTVNYFYALYILSRCSAFMCSGQCNGWSTVLSMNEDRFDRSYKFAVGINGDPRAEDFEVIRPITAGMFARGCYPTDKTFFLTNRFDLNEPVDPVAVKDAWDKTMKVYPYMSHAVVMRDKRLMLAKDPLPFVIRETAEIIEPSGAEGNFHIVTFCYLGKTLWIYIDHVPIDGTGYMRVLETFFYHYYCLTDNCVYPVPEGVHTVDDGEIPGQDVDAYLMAEPMDPQALMNGNGAAPEKSFVMPEAPKKGAFIPREDCRGFCISVPHDELMTYAKSVKGSPMSVMAVFFARTMERVHPENKLPIRFMSPVSIRKVMGNSDSLLHQVVHASYDFIPKALTQDDEALNIQYREFMKGFASEESIRMLCSVYRGLCEGYTQAFVHGMLNKIVMDQRDGMEASSGVSYLGTLKSAEYGKRMRMTGAHAMQEKGVMLQMAEVGDVFYINWYQGFHGEMYIAALRDLLREAGMKNVLIERTE